MEKFKLSLKARILFIVLTYFGTRTLPYLCTPTGKAPRMGCARVGGGALAASGGSGKNFKFFLNIFSKCRKEGNFRNLETSNK